MPSRPTPVWAATGFAAGTFVQTALGLRPVERLVPGEDELEFRDGSTGTLLHLHEARYTESALRKSQTIQPLRIPALAMGGSLPVRDMLVCGSLHVLAGGRLVNRVTERDQVLMPLASLIGYGGIERIIPKGGVTYYHPVAAAHRILRAEGLLCETLFLGAGAPAELIAAMPAGVTPSDPALLRLDAEIAARLAAKLMKKDRAPISEESAES